MEPQSDIFRTLAYLEPESSSKTYWTRKMIMHIQSSNIVRTVYSSIFKDIQAYSGILTHIQSRLQTRNQGEKESSPALFENRKKCPDFPKKGLDCAHLWVHQNVILRESRRKNSEMFSCLANISGVFDEIFVEVPQFRKPPPSLALKNLCLSTCTQALLFFAKRSI